MKDNKPLTKTQRRVLSAIAKCIHKFGYQPSYRELARSFGYTSPGAITAHLRACEKKGACQRVACRAVSFEWRDYL